ncbi:Na+/H+ antiporter subunit E [Oceanobacillus sp. 143]|uniref:Na+/H+ antiporter subunit E n=1 Tax=Oceanobacillus zhaokaii TaxID=2052660 RepID=A0A345PLB3_9BACI|nr:Na+/H+ antiporter subunit E [Oceanobacillus zhaokaii]AXI10793.1 Na+/H+ antiporter subunit E [Oceanobacillus zhaokaii]QGS69695.1 Na+/H+ antiporter subunit E [Oceanobacillus sp. 143]
MATQFFTNLFIAFLWTLFQDEEYFKFTTFVTGYIVGVGIVYLMHRFFGERFYLGRFYAFLKLVLLFISELIQSSYLVLKHILSPKIHIKPGIFKYETILESDVEVTALAMLLTLTPGSVVMEVTPEGDTFYIHGMDVKESKEMLLKSLSKFEKAIMEVTR